MQHHLIQHHLHHVHRGLHHAQARIRADRRLSQERFSGRAAALTCANANDTIGTIDVRIIELQRIRAAVAMLAEESVADDLADGRLRRVLPPCQASPISVYAITEVLPAKTQRFIEFLQERLGRA